MAGVALRGFSVKQFAKHIERVAKKAVFGIIGIVFGDRQETLVDDLQNVTRIIVVRPNYRIGNAILSTALIAPLRERFPDAAIDFLVTDKTKTLFANLPANHVHAISRSAYLKPWRAISLLRSLRTTRYDLAVQLAPSSLSGVLISRLLGARYVMGKSKEGTAWYDVNVKDAILHAYDTGPAFSRALGTTCLGETRLAVSDLEKHRALSQLQALGLRVLPGSGVEPFIAVFVGGHADKVCPLPFWLSLIEGLNSLGKRFVVFVGPEEKALLAHLQPAMTAVPHGVLCPPQPLRIFAAMLAQASLMITPDSGPMHMAAALSVPLVIMVQTKKSLAFIPPGVDTQIVCDLNVPETLVAVEKQSLTGTNTLLEAA